MGSTKDIVNEGNFRNWHKSPTADEMGRGAMAASGRFSVADLKKKIPDQTIKNKAEILTMTTAAFFEYFKQRNPDIETCFVTLLDRDGKETDLTRLLDKGDTTNLILMKLVHTPETYCGNDLKAYRKALTSGKLQCAVADIESIYRQGFPLGSSTFEKIFKEAGMLHYYEAASTYSDTVEYLNVIRRALSDAKQQGRKTKAMDDLLAKYCLKSVPNPGFLLDKIVYDSTTKFEKAGDRPITKEEEQKLSGLDKEGYDKYTQDIFPRFCQAQVDFVRARGMISYDGKGEVAAYKRKPLITDYACNIDENRNMIPVSRDGELWAVPTNKEIQRAVFRQNGVYAAKAIAQQKAMDNNDPENWINHFDDAIRAKRIDLEEVTRHSCELMAYAAAEVANRTLGRDVFESKPMQSWLEDFMPFASKVYVEGESVLER
ncbi:MAG: hypothetical protein ABIF10_05800 [Candidatus Woesearchaeota archaeon]